LLHEKRNTPKEIIDRRNPHSLCVEGQGVCLTEQGSGMTHRFVARARPAAARPTSLRLLRLRCCLPVALALAVGPLQAQDCRSAFADLVVATADDVFAPAAALGSVQRWRSAPYSAAWEGPGNLPFINASAVGYQVTMTPLSGTPPTMRTMRAGSGAAGSVVPWKSASGNIDSDHGAVPVDSFGPLHAGGGFRAAMTIDFDPPLNAFRLALMDLDWTGERVSNLRFIDAAGRTIRLSALTAHKRYQALPAPTPVPELSSSAVVHDSPGAFFYNDSTLIAYDAATDTIGRPSGVTSGVTSPSASVFIGLQDDLAIRSVAFDYIIEGRGGPKFTFTGRHACDLGRATPVPVVTAALPLLGLLLLIAAGAAWGRRQRDGV